MSRVWKISLAGLGSTLLVVLLAFYWLLHSASGATWLWKQVQDLTAGAVRSSRIEGDLASGFTIGDFKYLSDAVEVSVDRVQLQAGPGLWPVSVQIQLLSLKDVDIVTRSVEKQPGDTEPAIDIHAILGGLQLPIPVEVHEAVLTNIRLLADEQEPVTLVEALSLQLALDEQLRIENLQLQAADVEAGLQGYLALKSPFDLSILMSGSFGINGETAEFDQVFPFELEASGNLDRLQFSLGGLNNDLNVSGEILELAAKPGWDFKGELKHFQWPLNGPDDLITLSDLMLVSQGQIDTWSVDLESAVEYDVFQSTALTLSGSGSATGLQITGATLAGTGLGLDISGALGWSLQPQADLHVVISQLDLSPWLEEWPVGKYIAGDMQINWSESGLEIPPGHLTVPGTELAVNIEADIDVDSNTVDARLDWSGLNWPLASTTPDFSSPMGKLRIKGSLDQWEAAGQVDIQLGDYPQGHFDIQGQGNRASARLAIPGGEVLGGSVSGQASADWANGLSWDANIRVSGVDPAPLLPDWPGRLDAEARINAQSQTDSIQIDLVSLTGMLRGIPLNAKGGLNIEGDSIVFKDIELHTDEAVLQLDGSTSLPAGVAVKFGGHLPSVLLNGASGNVELEATYSSDSNKPLLEVHMEALDLAWNGVSVRSMSLSTQKTDSPGPVPAIELEASQLSWQEVLFDEFSLSLSPAGEWHQLKAKLVNDEINLSTAMTLASANTDDLFGGPWSGVLDELALKVSETYVFELLEPVALAWSADSAKLGTACLREDRGANLCLDGQYEGNGDWSLALDASAIPLDYLRDIFELDVQFEQMIEGHLEWHKPRGQAPTGGAEFRITAGRVLDVDDKELLVESNEGKLEFVLQNGNLESGALDIEFPGVGFIDFDFEVQNLIEFGARELNGSALAKLSDIKLIGQLAFPGIADLSGSFESNIQLGGTLSDPSFDGGFKLTNGLIQYSPVGLKLEDIEIDGHLEKRDRGKLEGRFRAGEGIGTLTGNFLFKDMDNLQIQLGLSGDQLLLVNTDTLNILTESDLKLEMSPQRMDINGHIRVPTARLTPANLLLETVSDSEDLIIETQNGELKTAVNDPRPGSRVYGELEVSFGDDVVIKVPGVETTFSGSVVYRWNGDPIPMAEGNYMLRGNVDVYGPRLLIDNGQISFPNVAANNPLLNIRAGRDIFGNTQIRSAGVQLTGTLKRPVLKAYTRPVTNEDRAWTLLVTGTDFDQGQGVSGFDVGTYIAPKLYVSYGISLFEDENVISARYDLKKGFGVKVTSGQRETGLDVSYTIDR